MAYQDYYALPGGDMPTPDLDQQRLDDAFRDVGQIPGLAAGSMTGVHGIASPSLGLWSATAFQSDQPDQSANVTRKTTDKSSEALHAGESAPGLEARSGDSLGAALAADTARDNAANISSGTPDQRDDRTPPDHSGAPPKLYDFAQPTRANMPGIVGNAVRGMSGLNNWIENNRATLLALAGGLAGAQSIGQGLGRGFTAAAATQPFATQQANQNLTALAFQKMGIPADLARIAAANPATAQRIIQRQLGIDQFQPVTIQGPFGQQVMVFDKNRGIFVDQHGRPIGQAPQQAAPAGVGGGQRMTVENFDPAKINHNLTGWDYLEQFPEEVEDAAKAYMQGGVMPTGNPRQNGIAQLAKTVAQKVAADLGQPDLADDTLYAQRRQMRTDLARSSNSSIGGLLSNGESAFGHLAGAATSLANLGNYSGGPWYTGGALPAHIGNELGSTGSEQEPKITEANQRLTRYGQESTKFYAANGGGVAEREQARKDINPAWSTSRQMAAFLAAEKDQMLTRFQDKVNQIRRVLGDQFLKDHPEYTIEGDKQMQQRIAMIDAAIAKLEGRGGQAPQQAQQTAPPAAPKPGNYVYDPRSKQLVPAQ
jgi:hypothetical protein